MEKNKSCVRIRFSRIAWFLLAILLFAAPCGAQYIVDGIEPENIDFTIEEGDLWVYGTANLRPGAIVPWAVSAFDGSVVNIYGGQVGFFITLFSETSSPVVTVYGKDFTLDDIPIDPSVTQFSVDPFFGGTLKGTYENGESINLWFISDVPINLMGLAPEVTMMIDIKPGSDQNSINLKSKGVVPVAVLTTGDFDAATIDPAMVEFAGAAPVRWKLEDVDDDGDDDMMFHFKTQELNLDQDSTEATLTAQLITEETVSGTDGVRIVPAKKSKKNK